MARPPDASNVNPVVNEASGDTMYATSAAISLISPVRPMGIFAVMYDYSGGVRGQ